MSISVLPKTSLGKWSLGLIITQYLGIIILSMVFHPNDGQTYIGNNQLFIIPLIFAWATGIFAFFMGIVSIIKNKEQSVLVFLSTLLGFINLCFAIYNSSNFF